MSTLSTILDQGGIVAVLGGVALLALMLGAAALAWPTVRHSAALPGGLIALSLLAGAGLLQQFKTAEAAARQVSSRENREAAFRHHWFARGVIESAPPDDTYVCHDWTFFGGPTGTPTDPEVMLSERPYEATDHPQPGDVIIYRDRTGTILHSGLVKATGAAGFVLVESKWGNRGLLLHLPAVDGLPAGTTWTFCRDAYGSLRTQQRAAP